MKTYFFWFCLLMSLSIDAQTISYEISFENAVHHEANIHTKFTGLQGDTVSLRMSRTSPGRYALHEFAKNVYGVKAVDNEGRPLSIARPDPYQWVVSGHHGTVNLSYTLFANRADGTYSQIDETHAHLNIPATFMYAPALKERSIEVTFKVREDLNWKVATQLPLVSGTTYTAPNLYYFMDSPVEISNYDLREFEVTQHGQKQHIQFVLHHRGTDEELDTYFEKVKKTVLAEKSVFGELPNFDYGTYTFLACYVPNASGDGMEHRNSTVLTSSRGLAQGGMDGNIGTVSHEFFHAWNVERIRPRSLEPFDFENANMSGALWFAEGFTSYYTNLLLCRAGVLTPEKYVESLTSTFNYVWNSPARSLFNPIQMSYQAPFVDAATSVDPVNRKNTFISYYSYGSMLGLALDLLLRENNLNLDDFMKQVWQTYGKPEKPYTLLNLQTSLGHYAGNSFANDFFDKYIYKSGMPNYKRLFESVGVILSQNNKLPYFGAAVSLDGDGHGTITDNPEKGGPAYSAELDKGDVITAINGSPFPKEQQFTAYLGKFAVGDTLGLAFERFGIAGTTSLVLQKNPEYGIHFMEEIGEQPTTSQLDNRNAWLKIK